MILFEVGWLVVYLYGFVGDLVVNDWGEYGFIVIDFIDYLLIVFKMVEYCNGFWFWDCL